MSTDYKDYVFELGSNPVRTYKGERMRPMDGWPFAMEVVKVLSGIVSTVEAGEEVKALIENKEKGIDSASSLSLIGKCLAQLDSSVYMGFVKRATASNLLVKAREGDATKTYLLDNEKNMNLWFEKHPSDMLMFTARIIFANMTPFLSDIFQNLSTGILET